MKIKLCGIKRPEDVSYMNEFRPDYVGLVFAGTKRRVTPETAARLAEKLDGGIGKIGVFVDEPTESIVKTAKLAGLNVIQLHGNESAESIAELRNLLPGIKIWKAVRVKDSASIPNALQLNADMLLLDSFSKWEHGGTGKTANFDLIRAANLQVPYFLAGGLNSENLLAILEKVTPYGVDISSGIETDGIKDRQKIEQIITMLRGVSGKAGN